MDLVLLQLNIRNWRANKYNFSVELSNYSPDVILLNETSATAPDEIKLYGYKVIQSCLEPFSGVAILIKYGLRFVPLYTKDPNTLAIKLYTSLGPVIVATTYSPPRYNILPTITLNKLLTHNLPTIFISDFNAHHKFLHNASQHAPRGDAKGNQIFSIARNKNLTFLGPDFYTYKTHFNKGTPDVVLANDAFTNLFHHAISEGGPVGSDHIPIIVKISTSPIKILIPPKSNVKTLDITKYKDSLKNDTFPNLNDQPVNVIDSTLEKIFNNIKVNTKKHCKVCSVITKRNYQPTLKIRIKLKQFQAAYNNYYTFGHPNINKLNEMKTDLINLTKLHKITCWQKVVNSAIKSRGNPDIFWKRIKNLQGQNRPLVTHLNEEIENDDSEDSDFGESITNKIEDPQSQANFMSETWSRVFQPNIGPEFKNPNTIRVKKWFNNISNSLSHDEVINFNNLEENHPLTRPITSDELRHCTSQTKNKAPGPSGITIISIKNLPVNYFNIILSIFNAIVASKYWPLLFHASKMVFAHKPGKDGHDPLNYRPIALLEILSKILERIITNRLLYFLEHNNLLPPNQFGFRCGRSTQHAIHSINETINENHHQRKTTLIATRDIQKAFDSVWHKGLLFKINVSLKIDLHFTAFIFNYISHRFVTPRFNSKTGPSFYTKAGVPQGSCLGPVLYLIFVYDLPKPFYNDTLITQFADDAVHVVRSDTTTHNRAASAKQKLERELTRTI